MSQLVKPNETFPSIRNLFHDFFDADKFFGHGFLENFNKNIPAVNIKETNDKFEFQLAAPGFNKGDFKIEIENGILKISAEKKEEDSEEKKNYTKKEFNYTSFERSFVLPETANENAINAEYKDGLLSLGIQKKEDVVKKTKKEISVL